MSSDPRFVSFWYQPLGKKTISAYLFLSAVVLSYPVPASAGVFSFLFDTGKQAVASTISSSEPSTLNAQTVSLLQATPSSDPSSADSDPAVVAGGAFLPDSGPLGTRADVEDGVPTSDQISLYTVHKGDSLSAIARMFGVSNNTIIWANDLKGPISEGQNLLILPISGVRYTVKKGDTLAIIANRFKGNAAEVATFNGIALGDSLDAGTVLIIPDGEIAVPVVVKKPVVATNKKPPKDIKEKYIGGGGPAIPGYYTRPLVGYIKTQGLHGYNGVDLAAPSGSTIYASAGGTVIVSKMGGWNGGYGNYVVISHPNGTQTLYAHMTRTATSVGDTVSQGEVVGYVGSTGLSTGPHLHFEVRGAANLF